MIIPKDQQERVYKAINRLNSNSDFQLFKDILQLNMEDAIVALSLGDGKDLYQAQGRYLFLSSLLDKTGRDRVREILDYLDANKK